MMAQFINFIENYNHQDINSKLQIFKFFPKASCILVFDNYIHFPKYKDAIFATIVTSILENKVIPEDIFNASLRCKQKCVDCRSYCSNMFVIYDDTNTNINIILDLPKMFNLEDLLTHI